MVKKTKKAAAKKPSKPSIAPSVPVTTIEDLLECGAALEKKVAILEERVGELERECIRRPAPSTKGHLSPHVTGRL